MRAFPLLILAGCSWFSAEEVIDPNEPQPLHKAMVPPPPELRCDGGKRSSSCFLEVEGGTFLMGAQSDDGAKPGFDADAESHEGPPHEVTVSPFWIQRGEVSTSAYTLCVENKFCSADEVATGGYSNFGDPTRRQNPMNSITWAGAKRYCEFVGSRLPTEAEWEFAARGTDGRKYPWGNKKACGVMDVAGAGDLGIEPDVCELDGTAQSGRVRGASAVGALGMGGNVWEWVADWYAEDAYANHAARDPQGPKTGTRRVQRGGGWSSRDPVELRSAARGSMPPDEKVNDVGFRCVRSR